jgi:hypothetical protein
VELAAVGGPCGRQQRVHDGWLPAGEIDGLARVLLEVEELGAMHGAATESAVARRRQRGTQITSASLSPATSSHE